MVAWCCLDENVKTFVRANEPLVWVALLLMIVPLCILFCSKNASRKVPYNYILLLLFTICLSYTVMFAASKYDSKSVLMAAVITAGMVGSLTLYSMCTKTDMTVGSSLLPIVGSVLSIVILFWIFDR